MRLAVVGGGLLGRFLSIELTERGHHVTLFEKGASDGSSSCGYVALGMLCPYSELVHIPFDDKQTFELGLRSLPLWESFLQKLSCTQDYLKKGCLLIARREEGGSVAQLKSFIQQKFEMAVYENLSSAQIKNYEPEISTNFFSGLFLPQEGCINPRQVFLACTNYFKQKGIKAHYDCAIDEFEKRQKEFDFIVDTRGLGAKKKELRGVRGETLRVYAPQVHLTRLVRVLDSKFPLYIIPRGRQEYTLGATCLESQDTKPISVRSLLEMLSMARYVHEGFMEASLLETNVQWRPALPDNQVKIEMQNNVMSVNGLFRHGILCAPALAQMAADKIENP